MKIGILANYISTRRDILTFCHSLGEHVSPILFLRTDAPIPGSLDRSKIEVRSYHLSSAGILVRVWNVVWLYMFLLFGVKPKSINNYVITESFKFSEIQNVLYRNYRMFILKLSRYTPQWITYDRYLSLLKRDVSVDLSGIDCFVITSEVYDDYLFYKMLNQSVPKIMYVYSWDHPCKMMRFSKKINYYLVWNEGLKQDLRELQFIPDDNIFVWGATQFSEIYNYLQTGPPARTVSYPFPYFYFVCATGKRDLVKAEVELVARTARCLEEIAPLARLVVRRYPFWKKSTLYNPLTIYKNVVIEDDSSNNSLQKYASAEQAIGLVHIGTTLGLEICYFKTPSLFLAFEDVPTQLSGFIHQYQNDKYLNRKMHANVLHDERELKQVFKACLSSNDRNRLLGYNSEVSGSTELKPMKQLSAEFLELITELVTNRN